MLTNVRAGTDKHKPQAHSNYIERIKNAFNILEYLNVFTFQELLHISNIGNQLKLDIF